MPSVELIKRIRTVATTEGMDKLVAELRSAANANTRFAESGNVVSLATAKLGREQLSAAKAIESTEKRVDAQVRNLIAYRREVANVALALQEGIRTQEEANRILDLAAIKYHQVGEAQDFLIQKQEDLERRARALREALDPVYAAQNRFNAAINEAEDLYTAGAIAVGVYEEATRRAAQTLREAQVGIVQAAKQQNDAAQTAFNTSFGVRDDFDSKKREADIAAYGQALNATRAEFDPLFAAQLKYRGQLDRLSSALRSGGIDQQVYSARLKETKAAFVETMASMDRISASTRSAREAAAQAAAGAASQATLTERVRAFALAADPALASQEKLNAALAEAEDLYTSGAISFDLYSLGVARARGEIDRTGESVRKLADAQADLERRAVSLRESLDPAYAAQNDFGAAVREAQDLYTSGAISIDVYNEAIKRAGRSLRAAQVDVVQEAKAKADAAQVAFNTSFGVRDDFGSEKRAADILAYGEALDATRAKYDAAFAAQREYDQFVVQAKADLAAGAISEDVYRTAIEKRTIAMQSASAVQEAASRAARAEAATSAQAKFNSSFGIGTKATDNGATNPEVGSAFADLNRLRLEFVPLEKAAAQYQDRLKQLKLLKPHMDADEYTAALLREEAAYKRVVKSIEESGSGASKSFRLTGYELTNLAYQFNDMATMAMSGSSAFQIVATQGGQFYQILAGSRGGLTAGVKNLGNVMAGLLTPTRLAGGGTRRRQSRRRHGLS
ncbi:phage tail length tape measure family protein [Azorhizobium doebereinerae]|uniref:phage tail length tape measure family protein n=1 Tax=Azorhizobium doebereinerae TaxID=281091 RepID=UPI000429264E|nr:phage tail length tape measure family protein [Azorhizobium doebereinerae]